MFQACGNQWRVVAGMFGCFYQGLDIPSVTSVMEVHEVQNRRTCLEYLRDIEAGALEVLNRH
uniref:hypothetical protein n=1 Tax=Halomonas sp. TaxID=1486246 RepID=UPI003458376D